MGRIVGRLIDLFNRIVDTVRSMVQRAYDALMFVYSWSRAIYRRFMLLLIPVLYLNLFLMCYSFGTLLYHNSVVFLNTQGERTGRKFSSLFMVAIAPLQACVYSLFKIFNASIEQTLQAVFAAMEQSINAVLHVMKQFTEEVNHAIAVSTGFINHGATKLVKDAEKQFTKITGDAGKKMKEYDREMKKYTGQVNNFNKEVGAKLEQFGKDVGRVGAKNAKAAADAYNKYTANMDAARSESLKVIDSKAKEAMERFSKWAVNEMKVVQKSYKNFEHAIDHFGQVQMHKAEQFFDDEMSHFAHQLESTAKDAISKMKI